jgi:hypothetical protein
MEILADSDTIVLSDDDAEGNEQQEHGIIIDAEGKRRSARVAKNPLPKDVYLPKELALPPRQLYDIGAPRRIEKPQPVKRKRGRPRKHPEGPSNHFHYVVDNTNPTNLRMVRLHRPLIQAPSSSSQHNATVREFLKRQLNIRRG